MKHFLIFSLLPLFTLFSCAEQIEVGTIEWLRNYDTAVSKSKETGKPIFLLFQEVPGCQGCQDFGREVLSNPLIKKSVEEAFIPLMIRNNASSGHDLEILQKFKEPAWNYQVVRFIDADGKDLIPRKDRIWNTKLLSGRMKEALKKAKQTIPESLSLVYQENDAQNHAVAAFAMYCFWTGEVKLGKINGVVSTEAGWLDGREVTLVKYHKETLSLKNLVKEAQKVDCAHSVYLPEGESTKSLPTRLKLGTLDNSYRTAQSSDQKKQLQGVLTETETLTEAQLTKLNAFIRTDRKSALKFL